MRRALLRYFFVFSLLPLAVLDTSRAALIYWDSDGATPGGSSGTTAAGTWGSSAFWSTAFDGSAATVSAWNVSDTAVFAAGADVTGAYTVTVSPAQTAAGLTVEEGSVSLTGSAVTVGTGIVTINAGAKLSIPSSANIVGSAGGSFSLSGILENTTASAPSAGASFVNSVMTVSLNGGTLSVPTVGAGPILQTASIISGTGPLTKTGAGILSIASPCTYSGATIITGGEIRIRTTPDRLPIGTDVTVNSGGILNLNAVNQQIASLAGAGTVGLGNATLTISGSGSSAFSGNIVDISSSATGGTTTGGGKVTLNKSGGAGTLTLSGANTFTGTLTLTAGTLTVDPGASLCGSICNLTANGGILNLNNAAQTVANLTGSAGTINLGSGNTLTTVAAGSGIFSGTLAGAGGLTKSDGNNLTLNGPNAYDGITTINALGTISVGNANALGSPVGKTVVTSGACLNFGSGGTFTINEPIDIAGTGNGVSSSGGAVFVQASSVITFGNTITLTADAAVGASSSGTATFNNPTAFTGVNRTLTLNGASGTTKTISGAITLGTGGLTKLQSGTWTLSGANTYSGATTIGAGGLSINSIATVGGGASALGAPTTVANGTVKMGTTTTATTLSYTGTGHTTDRIIDLAGTTGGATIDGSGTGPIVFTTPFTASGSGIKTLTLTGSSIDANGVNAVVNSSGGNTALTKSGTGKWVLSGASTYSGATTVSAGTLVVNGSLASGSAVSVLAGATLGGTGTIGGATTVAGFLAPGASIGTLNFGGNLALSGTNIMEIDASSGTAADLINMINGGTVTLGGNLTVNNLNGSLNKGMTFQLINGPISGSFATLNLPTPANGTWDTSGLTTGGNGTIKVICNIAPTAIPGGPYNTCPDVPVTLAGNFNTPGGCANCTLLWSPSTGLSDPTILNPTLTLSTPGTYAYNLSVTDHDGNCTGNATTSVTVRSRPTSVVTGDATVCPGNSTTIQAALTGFPLWNVTWSDGFTQTGLNSSPATRTVTPSATTIYSVTSLSDNFCTAQPGDMTGTATVTVTQPPAFVGGPTVNGHCDGGTVDIAVSASGTALSYQWRRNTWGAGGAWQLTGPASSSDGGFFIGDSQNNGDSGSLGDINTGGKAWGMYANSGNTVSAVRSFGDASGLAVGETVELSMDNGFIDNGGTVGFGLQNSAGSNVFEFYFAGGDPSYTVNAGSVSPAVNIPFTGKGLKIALKLSSAGNYTLMIVGAAVPEQTFTGTLLSPASGQAITQLRLFNANAGSTSDQDAYFNSITAGRFSDDASTYTAWNNGDNQGSQLIVNGGNVQFADTASLRFDPVTAANAGSYSLVASNSCGVATSTAATLTVDARPTAVASGGAPICNGETILIEAALTGASPWNVTWSDGAIQSTSTSPAQRVVSPSATTTFSVAQVSDGNCVSQPGDLSGSAVVTVNPRPTAVVSGSTTICPGGTAMLEAALTGTGPWTVTWSDGLVQSGSLPSPYTRLVSPLATTTYTVTAVTDMSCTAQAGDLTGSAVVTVGDTTAPVISLVGSASVTVECHTGYADAGATASDNCAGDLTSSIVTVNGVNPNTPGDYFVTYNVMDGSGNAAAEVTRTVHVVDTTMPVPALASLPDVNAQCSVTLTAPTAMDTCAGLITATTVDPTTYSTPGDRVVHWTYNDGNGNIATQTQNVHVHDTTPPVITLVGLANVTVECHSGYTDAGATALDNCDGTLSVVVSNPVDPNTPNTYTVRYNVSDAALNAAVEVTRTVHVVDTTAPVPTVASLADVVGQCSASVTAPTAMDSCAGLITATTVDPTTYSTPGDRVVHWTYNDGNGNIATQTQNVHVHDTTPPVITLVGLANVTVECHSSYTDAGATASDNCDGTLSVIVFNPVDQDSPGLYTVTYNVSDAVGNPAIQVTRTVKVVDSVAPTVTAGTIAACYATQAAAEAAALSATTVSDACDAAPAIVVSTVGSCNATITVRATDAAGNSASVDYTAHIASPPTLGTITATEAAANVKNCFTTTVQGTVNISVQASAACGLSGAPTIALVNDLNTEPAVFDGESPSGTFNYHWTVTASTPNGTWHATVSASDLCQTSTSNFTVCINTVQISGQLRLDGFVGTGTTPPHTRTVTFVATDALGAGANVLKTWVLPLSNVSGDTFSYVLSDAPGGTAAVSAKTDWTLRSKLPVTLDVNGQASGVDFTGTARLRGGDFDGDNVVNFPDYLVLGDKFFTFDATADITGDGDVDFDDYTALAENWLTGGDPQ